MPSNVIQGSRNIITYLEQIEELKNKKILEKNNKTITPLQKNKIIEQINKDILVLFKKVELESSNIFKEVQQGKTILKEVALPTLPLPKPQIIMPKAKIELSRQQETFQLTSETFRNLTNKEKEQYIKELNISYSDLEVFVKTQNQKQKGNIKEIKKEDYTIYKPSEIGEIANKYAKGYADYLTNTYPDFFSFMFKDFKKVEMEMLSRTYVSMMLFFTVLSFPLIFLFFLILNFAFNLSILAILAISIIGGILTFIGFYFYPSSLIKDKREKITLELPFALVHMSAVAGSGAQPISIFELIAESQEYPELRKEIKKILNYVNLFGYNLSNALRNVAGTTPSPEFKELLNGMISTIETGGDLKGYLKEKADESLNTYRLDRNKQVEALATYSEVYTTILVASPLLLLVTLAIINAIGGKIGGMDVKLIAWIGVLGALPLLNIGFMFFISASQKGI